MTKSTEIKHKTALVLEGGAMRGMYTAGVLDVYMKKNIKFDAIIGVSAGALFGVNYLSKQPGRVIRYNKKYNSDKNYLGLKPLLKTGNIIDTEYAYNIVPHQLDPFDDATFQKSDIPFWAVVNRKAGGWSNFYHSAVAGGGLFSYSAMARARARFLRVGSSVTSASTSSSGGRAMGSSGAESSTSRIASFSQKG